MRVVLDANVLFAAFATRGLCEAVLEVCLASHEIVVSEHILKELRCHMIGKLKLPTHHANEIVAVLREQGTVVQPAKVPTDTCCDHSDLPVLGTALAATADCLVTGDRDLLDLKHYQAVPILSPRAFHDWLR